MDSNVRQRLERLESTLTSLVDYINNNHINNVNLSLPTLQQLADRRREALARHTLNYYYNRPNNNHIDHIKSEVHDDDEGEDEIDGCITATV